MNLSDRCQWRFHQYGGLPVFTFHSTMLLHASRHSTGCLFLNVSCPYVLKVPRTWALINENRLRNYPIFFFSFETGLFCENHPVYSIFTPLKLNTTIGQITNSLSDWFCMSASAFNRRDKSGHPVSWYSHFPNRPGSVQASSSITSITSSQRWTGFDWRMPAVGIVPQNILLERCSYLIRWLAKKEK